MKYVLFSFETWSYKFQSVKYINMEKKWHSFFFRNLINVVQFAEKSQLKDDLPVDL